MFTTPPKEKNKDKQEPARIADRTRSKSIDEQEKSNRREQAKKGIFKSIKEADSNFLHTKEIYEDFERTFLLPSLERQDKENLLTPTSFFIDISNKKKYQINHNQT